ncbi:protein of unknown function [Burkholderia multivorans]
MRDASDAKLSGAMCQACAHYA